MIFKTGFGARIPSQLNHLELGVGAGKPSSKQLETRPNCFLRTLEKMRKHVQQR